MKFDFTLNIDATTTQVFVALAIGYIAYRFLKWCFE